MADFITKKENGRRLAIVILTVLADAVALTIIIYALKGTGKVEDHKDNPDNNVILRGKVEEQARKVRELETNYYGYARHIGWTDISVPSTDRFPVGAFRAEAMEEFLDKWAKDLAALGVANPAWKDGSEGLKLTALFDALIAKEKEYDAKIKDLRTKIAAKRDEEKSIREATATENQAAKEEIEGKVAANQPAAGLIGDLIKSLQEINKLQREHSAELSTQEKDTQDAQNKSTEVKNEIVRKRGSAESTKQEYARRINVIKHVREEEKERREPDGEILSVDEKRQLVYINLLRKDRLFKGTRFYTYSLEKGGQKLDKGLVEVTDVREENSSVCMIVSTKDPEWPIQAGDKIYNELYEGGRPRYIAFAGRFTGRLSNEEAASYVRGFGDHFQEKVDDKTNYVVVAEGFESHPNYKTAMDFGIKILREKILYDYLGIRSE